MTRHRLGALLTGVAIAATSLLVGPSAGAYDECRDGTIGGTLDTPSTKGQIQIAIGQHPNVIYLDIREVMGGTYTYSIWIYQESNGRVGLQRGGNTANGALGPVWEETIGNGDDSCQESTTPDTVLF